MKKYAEIVLVNGVPRLGVAKGSEFDPQTAHAYLRELLNQLEANHFKSLELPDNVIFFRSDLSKPVPSTEPEPETEPSIA